MKRLIGLLVIAALGFFVFWPAWSGYKIATALANQDAAALESKVDFPSVRDSLRPAVTAEIDKRIDKETQALGPLGGEMKKQMLPKLVEQMLASVVTPDNVIKIAHEGGDIGKSVEKVLGDAAGQMGAMAGGGGGASAGGSAQGGLGGVLGQVLGAVGTAGATGGGGDLAAMAGKVLGGMKKPAEPAPAGTAPATKRSFGLGNIKGFSYAAPLGFNIAVARDAGQAKADGTVGMSFSGGDWKLTRIIPNL